MIEPLLLKSGSAFCTVNSVPRTLVLKVESKCSSVTSSIDAKLPSPALAKRMSILPFSFFTVSYSLSRSASFEESACTPVTLLPICFTAL